MTPYPWINYFYDVSGLKLEPSVSSRRKNNMTRARSGLRGQNTRKRSKRKKRQTGKMEGVRCLKRRNKTARHKARIKMVLKGASKPLLCHLQRMWKKTSVSASLGKDEMSRLLQCRWAFCNQLEPEISLQWKNPGLTQEWTRFWQHLRATKLIPW